MTAPLFPKMGGKTVNLSPAKRELSILAVLLAVSVLVRVLLFPLPGYQIDTTDFTIWFSTAAQHGIRPFYSVTWSDYPPFNIYIFWAFGSLANAFSLFGNTGAMNYIIKLAPNIFDMATAVLIYAFVRKQLSFKLSLLATALYAFNPAVIFNAAVWGQFDAIYTFFLVLSLILALKSKPKLSAITFAVGLLTKPQAIALLPLIAFVIYKKSGLKNLLYSTVVALITVFVIILPFEWTNPITFLSNIYFGAYSGYAYTSINAFNFWALFGLWVPDGNLFILGWVLFGSLTVFTLYFLNKRFNASTDLFVLFSAFILFFGFFMLPTRIHERYLFPVISVLALMFPFLKGIRTRLIYVILSVTLFINEAYVLYWLRVAYPYAPNLTGDPVVLTVSLINLITFLYALMLMVVELKGGRWLTNEPATLRQNQERGEPVSSSS